MTDAPLRPLRLGTRRSPLAMAQAEEARARLCKAHGWAAHAVEIVPVTASGDKIQDRPLAEIGGKALWTKELDQWLMAGEIDFAVHSAKDVETWRPLELTIAAVLEREDVRDVLVLRQAQDERGGSSALSTLAPGSRIGTSAPRRAAQVLHLRPDCEVVSFRGNVATRLGKLAAGEADATLLALAGLNRLGQGHVGTPLALEGWLPAPGQGAIAIECRAEDAQTAALLAAIDHADSHATLMAERDLLAALGGNCHSAIGVHSRVEGNDIAMRAAIYTLDGAEKVEREASFPARDRDGPKRLAAELLAGASPALSAAFDPP